jgi:hypothetical protein
MQTIDNLSYEQLQKLDSAFEEYIFKQPLASSEPYAKTFRKDPRHFRAFIREVVVFKRDLMKLFATMYSNRWSLINYHAIPQGHVLMDEFDDYSQYFYDYAWEQYQLQLAQTIEQHKKKAYDLGILGLILTGGIATMLTSADVEDALTKQSTTSAQFMIDVTKDRIAKQIQASLKLGEDRDAFQTRIQDVFNNNYRGRMTAENEAVNSYLDAQYTVATDVGYTKKTWVGYQNNGNEICGQVMNNTVPIDGAFANGLAGPTAHFNCKCALEFS